MNIYYLLDKIKLLAIIALSTLLVIGFGLRISLLRAKTPIRIDNMPINMSSGPTATTQAIKSFMASKNGSKYYPIGCKAGERIKPENRIFFANREGAEAAGYTRAVNCP